MVTSKQSNLLTREHLGRPTDTSVLLWGEWDPAGRAMDQAALQRVIGGAGYVVYAIERGQSRVIALRAVALRQCSDNIEAEILACLFLVEEVAILVKQFLIERGISPKVVIQGDILPVIKYFQFAGRLRRLDMNQPLECIRTTVPKL